MSDSKKTDYEVEHAVVIGGRAAYLSSTDESADVIAGFTMSNDVSERQFHLEHLLTREVKCLVIRQDKSPRLAFPLVQVVCLNEGRPEGFKAPTF